MGAYDKLYVDRRLPTSKAYLALRLPASFQVLMLFYKKRKSEKAARKAGKQQYVFTNLKELVFTYEEAKEYGISIGKFDRAISELIEKGFIDVVSTGMGLHKTPTIYGLGNRWLKYETPEFEKAKRPRACQYNVGFQKRNTLWKRARRATSKTKTTAMRAHGTMRTDAHSEGSNPILVMRTGAHGKKMKTL